MAFTNYYLDFMDTYQRLDDSFYTQLCEMPNDFDEETKQLARELALVQLCALTDAYRVDITSLPLKTNHSILKKSKGSLSHVDLMNLGDWDLIYETIVRSEVERLTRVSYKIWVISLKSDQLLPSLSIDMQKVLHLEEVISSRNIIIHNKGIVDDEYQRRSNDWYGIAKQPIPAIGLRRIIDNNYYKAAAKCIMHIVETIDQEVANVT